MRDRALVCDAEMRRSTELADALREAGVSVTVAADLEAALHMVQEQRCDLVVASHGGEPNPFRLVVATRRDGKCSPAVILNLPGKAGSRMTGVLPIAAGRSRAGRAESTRVLRRAGLRLDRMAHEVQYRGIPLSLTPHEYRILECLLSTDGVVAREVIGKAAWGKLPENSNALDVHLGNLRRKLRAVSGQDLVTTRRGRGYAIEQQQPEATGAPESSLAREN